MKLSVPLSVAALSVLAACGGSGPPEGGPLNRSVPAGAPDVAPSPVPGAEPAETLNSAAFTPEMKPYHNPRFDYSIKVPADFTAGDAPRNGDGRVFHSPDGKAELRVSGSHNVLGRDLEEQIAAATAGLSHAEGQPTPHGWRGSGIIDKKEHQIRLLRRGDKDLITAEFTYPEKEAPRWKDLAAETLASLSLG